ncbi:16S rRNA (guanine(527)-N(7))-methyltransferase RsmG [candidate division WOR-3 bacterium]|nr:16S rRNA (guanine(527)-N(7))-methyltransferase RsmG [candidate division WOR-3 bacterium]
MNSDKFVLELNQGARKLEIKLSDSMIEKFKAYHQELLIWNQRINLISRRSTSIIPHFLDSLESVNFIPENARVLDVGTGAGFPGIPIKIVREDIELDLLEPRLKRFNFLNHIVSILKLTTNIYRKRVEEFSGKYDVLISKSVGSLEWFAKSANHLINSGIIITYKGSRFWDEFKKVKGWEIIHREKRKFMTGTIVVLKPWERNTKIKNQSVS